MVILLAVMVILLAVMVILLAVMAIHTSFTLTDSFHAVVVGDRAVFVTDAEGPHTICILMSLAMSLILSVIFLHLLFHLMLVALEATITILALVGAALVAGQVLSTAPADLLAVLLFAFFFKVAIVPAWIIELGHLLMALSKAFTLCSAELDITFSWATVVITMLTGLAAVASSIHALVKAWVTHHHHVPMLVLLAPCALLALILAV